MIPFPCFKKMVMQQKYSDHPKEGSIHISNDDTEYRVNKDATTI